MDPLGERVLEPVKQPQGLRWVTIALAEVLDQDFQAGDALLAGGNVSVRLRQMLQFLGPVHVGAFARSCITCLAPFWQYCGPIRGKPLLLPPPQD